LIAAAILIPILMMYAVSVLYSSRFQLPESAMRVNIPVILKNGRVYRQEGGRETPATIRDDDLRLTGLHGKWARKVDLGNFKFSIRPSLSPVGQPVARVTSQAADMVVSRYGSRRGKGDPGGNLSNVWALALSQSALANAGLAEDGQVRSPGYIGAVSAELMALVPSGSGPAGAFTDIISDVEQRGLSSLEGESIRLATAMRKAAEIREVKGASQSERHVDSGNVSATQSPKPDPIDPLPGDTLPYYADSSSGSVSVGGGGSFWKSLISKFQRSPRVQETATFFDDDLPT
jgi:hypothetical protein